MENTIWKYVDLFSAIFCIIYALQTLILRKKIQAYHRYFFLFLMSLGVLLVFLSLVAFKVKIAVLAVLPVFELAFLNLAPSMYLNVKSLVSPTERKFHLKHFIIPISFLFTTGVCSSLSLIPIPSDWDQMEVWLSVVEVGRIDLAEAEKFLTSWFFPEED